MALRRAVRHVRPRTPNQLHAFVRFALGYSIPRTPLIEGHDAPFDYLVHAFFEDRAERPRDCVVWSNRGGGKTLLGAIATLLDLLFKPGIQVRILAGSFDQASRMYHYLSSMLTCEAFADLIDGRLTQRCVELTNGSRAIVLAQSQMAVRGQHVHKLRCDEVELFDAEVWEAAQLVTRSGQCGDIFVHGSIEALSTMHRPYGLMHTLVCDAELAGRRVFRWGAMDVLARCEPERKCETCKLWSDCQGRAKKARGFLSIDDALQQRSRVSDPTWHAEMLCKRPSRSSLVYPQFDPEVHVVKWEETKRSRDEETKCFGHDSLFFAGMDLGYRAPTVLLWAALAGGKGASNGGTGVSPASSCVLHIVDELVISDTTAEQIIALAGQRPWPRPRWIGADPAGRAKNDQTGRSTLSLWRQAGWPIRTVQSTIAEGVEAVRRRLRAADGEVRLLIDPRCTDLIEALSKYHYPADQPESLTPVKDGNDHAADALRYLIINLDRPKWRCKVTWY